MTNDKTAPSFRQNYIIFFVKMFLTLACVTFFAHSLNGFGFKFFQWKYNRIFLLLLLTTVVIFEKFLQLKSDNYLRKEHYLN